MINYTECKSSNFRTVKTESNLSSRHRLTSKVHIKGIITSEFAVMPKEHITPVRLKPVQVTKSNFTILFLNSQLEVTAQNIRMRPKRHCAKTFGIFS